MTSVAAVPAGTANPCRHPSKVRAASCSPLADTARQPSFAPTSRATTRAGPAGTVNVIVSPVARTGTSSAARTSSGRARTSARTASPGPASARTSTGPDWAVVRSPPHAFASTGAPCTRALVSADSANDARASPTVTMAALPQSSSRRMGATHPDTSSSGATHSAVRSVRLKRTVRVRVVCVGTCPPDAPSTHRLPSISTLIEDVARAASRMRSSCTSTACGKVTVSVGSRSVASGRQRVEGSPSKAAPGRSANAPEARLLAVTVAPSSARSMAFSESRLAELGCAAAKARSCAARVTVNRHVASGSCGRSRCKVAGSSFRRSGAGRALDPALRTIARVSPGPSGSSNAAAKSCPGAVISVMPTTSGGEPLVVADPESPDDAPVDGSALALPTMLRSTTPSQDGPPRALRSTPATPSITRALTRRSPTWAVTERGAETSGPEAT